MLEGAVSEELVPKTLPGAAALESRGLNVTPEPAAGVQVANIDLGASSPSFFSVGAANVKGLLNAGEVKLKEVALEKLNGAAC